MREREAKTRADDMRLELAAAVTDAQHCRHLFNSVRSADKPLSGPAMAVVSQMDPMVAYFQVRCQAYVGHHPDITHPYRTPIRTSVIISGSLGPHSLMGALGNWQNQHTPLTAEQQGELRASAPDLLNRLDSSGEGHVSFQQMCIFYRILSAQWRSGELVSPEALNALVFDPMFLDREGQAVSPRGEVPR
jgi:hypothetical protein